MTTQRHVAVLCAAALVAFMLSASTVLAAKPKDGKYAGQTTSGEKISITVTNDGEKTSVKYCGYKMGDKVKNGKFKFAYKGPGGVYVGGEGEFTSKKKAKGKITTDFLCDTEGESFTATRT
jgi:hypothetical protein